LPCSCDDERANVGLVPLAKRNPCFGWVVKGIGLAGSIATNEAGI